MLRKILVTLIAVSALFADKQNTPDEALNDAFYERDIKAVESALKAGANPNSVADIVEDIYCGVPKDGAEEFPRRPTKKQKEKDQKQAGVLRLLFNYGLSMYRSDGSSIFMYSCGLGGPATSEVIKAEMKRQNSR